MRACYKNNPAAAGWKVSGLLALAARRDYFQADWAISSDFVMGVNQFTQFGEKLKNAKIISYAIL